MSLAAVLPGRAVAGDDGDMTFALAGDSIIARRISTFRAPGVESIWEVIRGADVAFTNFETLVHDFDLPGEALSGGTYMGSPAYVVSEIEWAGFDMVGLANNHTFDYGVEGMRRTRRAIAESKLVGAGTAENLALARAPGFFDTGKGRVALISCASTFTPASAAGAQRPDILGRPGLSPLRFETRYTVDAATFATIKELRGNAPSVMGEKTNGDVKFQGATWVLGDVTERHTRADATDLAELVQVVKHARLQADWVMVSIHAHENADPANRDVAAEFVEEFAHAMVDAGADLVVGHGPHVWRGIEIRAGKPIFYSIGNFIFENDLIAYQPAENYAKVGLGADALPSDYYTKRSKNDTAGFPAVQGFWESAVAEVVFDASRQLREIRLHPIELGFQRPRVRRGQPYPASDEAAERILGGLAKLSAAYGVTVAVEDGVGVVRATMP